MTSEQLILITFGALLGLITGVLGKAIYDSIAKLIKSREILKVIITELKVLKLQYIYNVYLIYGRYSLLTRENIAWLIEKFKIYETKEDVSKIIQGFGKLEELTDDQLRQLNILKRLSSQGSSLIPKKTKILFIEQNLHLLDFYDTNFQYKIIQIMEKIDRLNQQIDIAHEYEWKTFEVEDPDNHDKICSNLDMSLENLGNWEKSLVDDISSFIKDYEDIHASFAFQK